MATRFRVIPTVANIEYPQTGHKRNAPTLGGNAPDTLTDDQRARLRNHITDNPQPTVITPTLFLNQGEECYRNAALTVLLHLSTFRSLVAHVANLENAPMIFTHLSQLATAYWNESSSEEQRKADVDLHMGRLYDFLKPDYTDSDGRPCDGWNQANSAEGQGDPLEYIQHIFARAHDSLIMHPPNTLILERLFRTDWLKRRAYHCTCDEKIRLDKTNRRDDAFLPQWAIPLGEDVANDEISQNNTLDEMLVEQHIAPHVNVDLKRVCPTCKKEQLTFQPYHKLTHFPEVLTIGVSSRRTSNVLSGVANIPEFLDFSSLLDHPSQSVYPEDNETRPTGQYQLKAVIGYEGGVYKDSSLGHYTAQIRRSPNDWIQVDDFPKKPRVRDRDFLKLKKGETPRGLFYVQIHKDWKGVIAESEKSAEDRKKTNVPPKSTAVTSQDKSVPTDKEAVFADSIAKFKLELESAKITSAVHVPATKAINNTKQIEASAPSAVEPPPATPPATQIPGLSEPPAIAPPAVQQPVLPQTSQGNEIDTSKWTLKEWKAHFDKLGISQANFNTKDIKQFPKRLAEYTTANDDKKLDFLRRERLVEVAETENASVSKGANMAQLKKSIRANRKAKNVAKDPVENKSKNATVKASEKLGEETAKKAVQKQAKKTAEQGSKKLPSKGVKIDVPATRSTRSRKNVEAIPLDDDDTSSESAKTASPPPKDLGDPKSDHDKLQNKVDQLKKDIRKQHGRYDKAKEKVNKSRADQYKQLDYIKKLEETNSELTKENKRLLDEKERLRVDHEKREREFTLELNKLHKDVDDLKKCIGGKDQAINTAPSSAGNIQDTQSDNYTFSGGDNAGGNQDTQNTQNTQPKDGGTSQTEQQSPKLKSPRILRVTTTSANIDVATSDYIRDIKYISLPHYLSDRPLIISDSILELDHIPEDASSSDNQNVLSSKVVVEGQGGGMKIEYRWPVERSVLNAGTTKPRVSLELLDGKAALNSNIKERIDKGVSIITEKAVTLSDRQVQNKDSLSQPSPPAPSNSAQAPTVTNTAADFGPSTPWSKIKSITPGSRLTIPFGFESGLQLVEPSPDSSEAETMSSDSSIDFILGVSYLLIDIDIPAQEGGQGHAAFRGSYTVLLPNYEPRRPTRSRVSLKFHENINRDRLVDVHDHNCSRSTWNPQTILNSVFWSKQPSATEDQPLIGKKRTREQAFTESPERDVKRVRIEVEQVQTQQDPTTAPRNVEQNQTRQAPMATPRAVEQSVTQQPQKPELPKHERNETRRPQRAKRGRGEDEDKSSESDEPAPKRRRFANIPASPVNDWRSRHLPAERQSSDQMPPVCVLPLVRHSVGPTPTNRGLNRSFPPVSHDESILDASPTDDDEIAWALAREAQLSDNEAFPAQNRRQAPSQDPATPKKRAAAYSNYNPNATVPNQRRSRSTSASNPRSSPEYIEVPGSIGYFTGNSNDQTYFHTGTGRPMGIHDAEALDGSSGRVNDGPLPSDDKGDGCGSLFSDESEDREEIDGYDDGDDDAFDSV